MKVLNQAVENIHHYSPQQRLVIGKYATEHRTSATVKFSSSLLSRKINESTVRGFKKDYLKELCSRKRKLVFDDCTESVGMPNFLELPTKKVAVNYLWETNLIPKFNNT